MTSPGRARVLAALGFVYVAWGGTYLGILIGIRTLPVFVLTSVRFLIAGLVLYAWVWWRRGDQPRERPTGRQWAAAAALGISMPALGNGGVTWAEQHVSSGVASLVIALVPLFMALFDRTVYGQRLTQAAVVGLVIGFGGAVVLAWPSGVDHVDTAGALVLVGSALSWSLGSLWSRAAPHPRRPGLGVGMQMICAGVGLGIVSLAAGEPWRMHDVSAESLGALAYLIVPGSIVAYSAYFWLLRAAPTSLVSTYAFVNPIVAVFLGWLFENERVGPRTLIAGTMIVVAVALIVSRRATLER